MGNENPSEVFLYLLISKSGSMETSRKGELVIQMQNRILDALKDSEVISARRKRGLMITQWLFDEQVYCLHSFKPLVLPGNDPQHLILNPGIVRLNYQNYRPGGLAALRDVLAGAIVVDRLYRKQAQVQWVEYVQSVVCVLTDGEDTASKTFPDDEALRPRVAEMVEANQRDKRQGIHIVYAGIGDQANHRQRAQNLGIPQEDVCADEAPPRKIAIVFDLIDEDIVFSTWLEERRH